MTVATRPEAGPARDYHFPGFVRDRLENGLNVIVATAAKLPIVTVVAVIEATALGDDSGKEGTAELTAQALREGTMSRDGLELALDLEKLGTSLEAGADWDSTVASMTVLKTNLAEAFEILGEVIMSPLLNEKDIERLKAERLAERMQILDEPRGLADESFAKFVYAEKARFASPMSGSSKSVSAIRRDDIEAYYRRNYVPPATTLIMAGDITPEEGIALAQSTFGSWRGERAASPVNADSPARTSRAARIVAKPDAAQAELRIGHVGIPRSHPDYFRIVVMNAVLGGLFSSRINLNLREAHGYTYGASSYFDWRRQSGPFVISTAVQTEVTAAAITETLKEIDRMREEEIGEDELTLATSYLEGVFPIRYETTAAIASALANLATFGLPEDYYDTYRDNIASVTTRHVLNAARKYVKPEELQVLVVGNPEAIREPLEALGLGALSVQEAVDD
ncbi:MAG TPA: pitrilysin family protein [Gemmatimonadaceae bacterium]|nr:pitrilysin family protein [Gemmatimonadaceae bacterium]